VAKENKHKAALLKWASDHDLVVCKRDALYRLVRIINEVALGVDARVDDNGEVHFNHCPDFDYQEMVGLKLIIHADPKFQKPSKMESEDTNEEADKDQNSE
jgi:hypothetical protein